MNSTAKISFIIPIYKSEKFISRCLSSISKNCNDVAFEIIIVNNDKSNFNFPSEIKKINLEKNLGYGSACNRGAKIATEEILCFLNPDTEILDDASEVINYFENNENAGIIGAKLVTSENKTQPWCAGKEMKFCDLFRNKLGFSRSKKIWESSKEIECDWVSGACLFIRKNIFEELNGFDEKFFMYFEDMDLCKRTRNLGHKIIYFPKFHVKHFGGKSFSNKFKQKKQYYSSLIHYLSKK